MTGERVIVISDEYVLEKMFVQMISLVFVLRDWQLVWEVDVVMVTLTFEQMVIHVGQNKTTDPVELIGLYGVNLIV